MKIEETEKQYIITGEVECSSCNGTGLYKGMAEGDNSAVVCWNCEGTGKTKIKITYNKVEGRKIKKGVKRVYAGSCGYFITDKDVTIKEDNKTIHFSKSGVSYEEWLKGKKPMPIKELHCPYQHTNQGLQTKDVNGLYATRCSKVRFVGSNLSGCALRPEKDKCWEIFEGKK